MEAQSLSHRPFSRTVPQEEDCRPSHLKTQSLSNDGPEDPQATLTLSQYLPHLQFLHPSHFTNLEKPPSCQPVQTLPARLRTLDQQRKVTEDACTNISTFTTTLNRRPATEKCMKAKLQNRSRGASSQNHRFPEPEKLKENPLLAALTMNKQPSYTRLTEETRDQRRGKISHTSYVEQSSLQRDKAEAIRQERAPLDSTVHQTTSAHQRAEHMARLAVLEDTHNRHLERCQPRKLSAPKGGNGKSRLKSESVMRGNVRERSYGDGCIPTYVPHGEYGKETYPEWGLVGCTADKDERQAPHLITSTEYAIRDDDSAWFAGQWPGSYQHKKVPDSVVEQDVKGLKRRQLISGRAASENPALHAFGDWHHYLAKLSFVKYAVYNMARHVVRTLHHESSALRLLRSPYTNSQDYMDAVKDVALAVVYMLVLLNFFVVLRKLCIMAAKVVYWVWHPMDLMAVVFKWCVMT